MYGSADEAYKQTREEIDKLIEKLQDNLTKMDLEQFDNKTNWGYVGNVVEVKRQLEELVRFT